MDKTTSRSVRSQSWLSPFKCTNSSYFNYNYFYCSHFLLLLLLPVLGFQYIFLDSKILIMVSLLCHHRGGSKVFFTWGGRGRGVTGILGLHNQWRMFPICCNLRNEPNWKSIHWKYLVLAMPQSRNYKEVPVLCVYLNNVHNHFLFFYVLLLQPAPATA